MYTAILGGEVTVPTPKGTNLALKVPPETANGQRIRLAGQGMPRVNGTGRGDLYAEITVQLPKNLSRRTRKTLFAELARLRSGASARVVALSEDRVLDGHTTTAADADRATSPRRCRPTRHL